MKSSDGLFWLLNKANTDYFSEFIKIINSIIILSPSYNGLDYPMWFNLFSPK